MATETGGRRAVLGLFRSADATADGVDALRAAGFRDRDLDVLTDSPFPEGAFGERPIHHRLYMFPLMGAACGFAVGVLITVGTQFSFPLVTGGKPILSIPPMINVLYEGTMLGALIFTVLGVIFESRLPHRLDRAYDPRIMRDGLIGLEVKAAPDQVATARDVLRDAGAVDVVGAAAE
ncbi:MAG TPA: DUF3341 domain-containing protein [Chloroflexota bacterium]|nr:DUF3341 domain-containing protein [Chloroflexota bacterium]